MKATLIDWSSVYPDFCRHARQRIRSSARAKILAIHLNVSVRTLKGWVYGEMKPCQPNIRKIVEFIKNDRIISLKVNQNFLKEEYKNVEPRISTKEKQRMGRARTKKDRKSNRKKISA